MSKGVSLTSFLFVISPFSAALISSRMSYEMDLTAYVLTAAMLLVVVVTHLAASGRIQRNGFVGIRIPPTMAVTPGG